MLRVLSSLFRLVPPSSPPFYRYLHSNLYRHLLCCAADTGGASSSSGAGGASTGPQSADANKPAVVRGKSENPDPAVRVRRARASDIPNVLRFVREHAQASWPGVAPPPSSVGNLVLGDYISRTLAQGHSLVAELPTEAERARRPAGLALGAAQCAWDAALLDSWASCVRCRRSRALLRLTAHCLREPRLHEKYSVSRVLQILILVPESPRAAEVSLLLVKRALERGRDAGYPLLRFDVSDCNMAAALEKMNLTKEWQFPADKLKEVQGAASRGKERVISVYTAQTQKA